MIVEFIEQLEQRFSMRRASVDIHSTSSGDIDLFAHERDRAELIATLQLKGFAVRDLPGQVVAYRFVSGELFILDFTFTFDHLLHLFPTHEFNDRFAHDAWENPELEKFFRYVFFLRDDEKSIEFVRSRFGTFGRYLYEDTYFAGRAPFRANSSVDDVVGVMKGRLGSLIQSLRLQTIFSHYAVRFRNRIQLVGSGAIIAIVGPDGSGKSTVIERLASSLDYKRAYMGDWGFALQPLYNWMHGQHIIIARLTYPFFFIENWLRYCRIWFLKLRGKTVLVDRYPGLNRHLRRNNVWLRLNDIMYWFFPRADKYIFISASPEVIHKRKPELSVSEIAQSQENIRKRLQTTKHREIQNIDLEKCLTESLAYILEGKR